MDIRLFVGAHKTASKHLSAMLSGNIEFLEAHDVIFHSNANRTLRLINGALKAINEGGDKTTITNELIHALSYGRDVKTLLIVSPNISGAVTRPFGTEFFYPRTTGLVRQLQTLFDNHPMQFFASIRNPASFIPSCYADGIMHASFTNFSDFINEADVQELKWSTYLHRLQGKQADIPLTVWRQEDYAYIWRDVIQAFTGIRDCQNLIGTTDRINYSLTLHGTQLLNRYVQEYPPQTKEDFEKTKQAFLDRFPSTPDDLAGLDWPPELVQQLTDNYDDDWYYVERMDGVHTIQPRKFS